MLGFHTRRSDRFNAECVFFPFFREGPLRSGRGGGGKGAASARFALPIDACYGRGASIFFSKVSTIWELKTSPKI